jgi:hypothetical protein
VVSVLAKDTFSECQWNQKFFSYSESQKFWVTAKGNFLVGDEKKKDKTAGECCMKPLNGSCGTVVA